MNKLKIIIIISCILTVIYYCKNLYLQFFLQPQITSSYFVTRTSAHLSEIQAELDFDYMPMFDFYKFNYSTLFGIPFISNVFQIIVSFQSFADHVFLTNTSEINPDSVKCGDIVFVKTDYLNNFFEKYHTKIKTHYILISHRSDYSIGYPKQLKYLNDSKIIMWYGQNPISKHKKLKPLPIGISIPPNTSVKPVADLARQVIPFYKRKNLLYLNFSPDTNPNRSATLKYFIKTFKNNSNVIIDRKRISWVNYLNKLKHSRFVLSPPGNGIDCWRTWEALTMGAVPIVLSSELQPLYDDMPIMVVKSWKEVTEENMEKFQHKNLSNFSSDGIPWRPKIWLRYWINEIMNLKLNSLSSICHIKK